MIKYKYKMVIILNLTPDLVIYALLGIVFLFLVLYIIQAVKTNNLKKELQLLEKAKNEVIGATILSELNKVEALVKNEKIEKRFSGWQKKFNLIKNDSLNFINDMLLEADFLLAQKKYRDLLIKIADIEIRIYEAKAKTNNLLNEIQTITLSEEKNRKLITDLKGLYRDLLQTFIKQKETYGKVRNSIELQFENIEKRFQEFELAIENTDFDEVNRIVKATDDMIKHMAIVIEEVPAIVLMIDNVIPQKKDDIIKMYNKMKKDGYQLDYLNVEYNLEEITKKINNIIDRVKVLNLEEALFELKTFVEYFDNLFNDFERERLIKKVFEENVISFKSKLLKLNDIVNQLYEKIEDLKYCYDVSNDQINLLDQLNDDLNLLNNDFKALYDTTKAKSFPYSRLNKEIELLMIRLTKMENRLDSLVDSIGNMQGDEQRAYEQLNNINELLKRAKYKLRDYKLPMIPDYYFIELKEAQDGIKEINKELARKPINIETLNTRVDTARDLVFKLYNTTNELVKTGMLTEMAIIYGNRYRTSKRQTDEDLSKAEFYFLKGDYKRALELSISAIELIEPGIYRRLLNLYEEKI